MGAFYAAVEDFIFRHVGFIERLRLRQILRQCIYKAARGVYEHAVRIEYLNGRVIFLLNKGHRFVELGRSVVFAYGVGSYPKPRPGDEKIHPLRERIVGYNGNQNGEQQNKNYRRHQPSAHAARLFLCSRFFLTARHLYSPRACNPFRKWSLCALNPTRRASCANAQHGSRWSGHRRQNQIPIYRPASARA